MVAETYDFLQKLTFIEVKRHLSDTEQKVLMEAISQNQFTNSSLAGATKKSKQNIRKYINRFLELNFIYFAEKRGRNTYYNVEPKLGLLGVDMKGKPK